MSKRTRSRPLEDQDSEHIPEPGESGPREREAAFLEQRLSRLRQRQVPSDQAVEQPLPGEEEQAASPALTRQRLLAEYRRRQRAQRATPVPEPPSEPAPPPSPCTSADETEPSSP
ncbi:MAG: hypothetical protein FJ026_08365 [Chloroflexi bacterium]|nr:hypothetical protein [Chloroflexota bacterium]